jgi:arginase
MLNIHFIENRSEIGAGTRGASLGPKALRLASLNKGSGLFKNVKITRIKDENKLLFTDVKHPFAKRIEGVSKIYDRVCEEVSKKVSQPNSFTVILAGDHSSAGGTIAGIKKAFPDKRLGVIWIDAHADLHSPYTTPSGNMHGMPLCISLGEDNKLFTVNDVPPKTIKWWEKIKKTGGIAPKLLPKDVVFIAVRSAEDPEEEVIKRYQIKDVWVKEFKEKGPVQIAAEAIEHLEECDIIYVSFDVDSMDSEISKGTGTPMPNGITETEASTLVCELMKSPKICCLEITEINPLLDDKCNLMAENAFMILNNALNVINK